MRLARGRFDALCMTVATLIRTAYRRLENNDVVPMTREDPFFWDRTYGLGVEDGTRVRGGPDWVNSERYTISAVAQGRVDAPTLAGPMLLDLLERRFRLRTHVASENLPVWALEIAKGGLKIKPAKPGSCFQRPVFSAADKEAYLRSEEARGDKPLCRMSSDSADLMRFKQVAIGQSMKELASSLSRAGFRTPEGFGGPLNTTLDSLLVIDKTGVPTTTLFDFTWEYGGDPDVAAKIGVPIDPTDPRGPTIFEALDKLGLRLERSRGSREFIVIDHVEKPSPN